MEVCSTKDISSREKKFCEIYVICGDGTQAAQTAGYDNPDRAGAALLCRDEIICEIGRLYERHLKNARQKAYAGYERIAFGSVNDAVRLLFENVTDTASLEEYDLYNVAEIRRPKEGALEIKFFDRLKALEKLEQYGQDGSKSASDFYQALVGGTARLPSARQECDS